MPYAHDKQNAYQLRWTHERRARFLKWKKCEECGSTDHLEFGKKDPVAKLAKISWSWSLQRLRRELKNRKVLCRKCGGRNRRPFVHGRNGYDRWCRCATCRWSESVRLKWQRLVNGRKS